MKGLIGLRNQEIPSLILKTDSFATAKTETDINTLLS